MNTNTITVEKPSAYQALKAENQILQNGIEEVKKENKRLNEKVSELNEKIKHSIADENLLKQHNEGLKSKIQVLRDSETILKSENNRLKDRETILNTENKRLKDIEENLKAENNRLKNSQANLNTERETILLQQYNQLANAVKIDTENGNAVISYLKELNQYFSKKSERLLNEIKPLFAENMQIKSEINVLKAENAVFKQQQASKNKKMHIFMIIVSILAIFANLTHIGEKYLSLVKNPTILETIVCYTSMLVFDFCVFLFTIKGQHESAKKFAIGTFLIVFFQLGQPFDGFGISAIYAEKIFLGLIYSGMFAFIPYKLSELFTAKK